MLFEHPKPGHTYMYQPDATKVAYAGRESVATKAEAVTFIDIHGEYYLFRTREGSLLCVPTLISIFNYFC